MMTTGTTITCPHCGASNVGGSAFCESCGKALPAAIPGGPRVVSADAVPTTAVGHRMVSDELAKTQRKAAGALLAVGIIQLVFGAILWASLKNAPGAAENAAQINLVLAIVIGVGMIYFALYFWARKSPLPAAIVGLVLYLTLLLVDAVTDPTSIGRGIILKVIIIAVLAQAIQAGLKHKQLLKTGGMA